jgi:hypothetical protein
MKSRSTRFPNFNPGTAAGLMTWILIIALCLPLVRSFVALGWDPAGVAFLCVVFLVAWYGLVALTLPIVFKRKHWVAADRQYLPMDLDSDLAPEAFRSWAAGIIPSMHDLGFTFRGHFRPSQAVPHTDSYITLFENRTYNQTAQLFTVTARRGIIRRSETVLAFVTEFEDQTKLYTSNSRSLPLQPNIRVRDGSMLFPEIDDPRRLYEIHQATIASFGHDAVTRKIVIDDPIEFLRTSFHSEVAKFAESGYYFLDAKRGRYRLTWMGAILMAWKNLWPFNWIRELRRRGQAARLLRKLSLS